MNTKRSTNKFVRFLQNNMVLLIIIMSVIAIAGIVLIATLSGPTEPNKPVIKDPIEDPDNPTIKPGDEDPVYVKVYFDSPLEYTSVSMEYSDGKDVIFVFNQTLNEYRTHRAVDLIAADGTAVASMYGGTIIKVADTYAMGNSVTIDHGNGVVATYASLGTVDVVEGQVVTTGQKIGNVGITANNEFMDGAHLHLEVKVNDKFVDPMPYVNGEIYFEVEEK